jgi:hypothetical protein
MEPTEKLKLNKHSLRKTKVEAMDIKAKKTHSQVHVAYQSKVLLLTSIFQDEDFVISGKFNVSVGLVNELL